MTTLRFQAGTLHASRFALSPLAETLSELATLRRALDRQESSSGVAYLETWLRDDAFADGLVRLITSTKFLPDFVALPPTGVHTRIDDELTAMARIDDRAAEATLLEAQKHSWTPLPLDWHQGGATTERAARVFHQAWTALVAPDWFRRRAVMERDIRHRAGVIALRGWRDALHGMAPDLHWTGPDAIQFSTQTFPDRHIGADGLVLVPHTASQGQWTCETPDQIALVYRARGTLAPPEAPRRGIATLVGATRTRVLAELNATAATPSQLSATLGLSLGTISAHLAALSTAGTVTKRRTSRAVYYELTTSGSSLLDLCSAEPSLTLDQNP